MLQNTAISAFLSLFLFCLTIEEVGFMVLNATFNNISVISWRSVLLVEETAENHRPVTSH
jgi:hypothetical protein